MTSQFTTRDGVWGTAGLIETDNASDAGYPRVAMDASGNAVAVWHQSDGTRKNIWSNRYIAGTGWGTATLIETENLGEAVAPQVAIDASGNALAVWFQYDGTRNNIWSNRYTAGSGWGAAMLIETDNAGDAYYPQIAFDASGNALAVWTQVWAFSTGRRYGVWSNRYTAGSGWGTAALIATDTAVNAVYPEIAFDASGNGVAVWKTESPSGTTDSIWSSRYTAGSG